MKAKFTVSPTLKSDCGVETAQTEMLMITKIHGMALGAGPRAIDNLYDGRLSQLIEAQGFTGDVGQSVVLDLGEGHLQRYIVLVGLGTVAKFNPCTLFDVVDVALDQALARGCSKLSIPVVANRLTGLNLNLRGTSHIVRQGTERRLARLRSKSGTLEVELICTPQAKRHLEEGLNVPCRHKQSPCCTADKS